MVHLNTTPQPAIASSDPIFAKTTSSTATALPTTAATSSTDSFATQLTTAIEGYLAQSGNGSQFEIDIQKGQAQATGGPSQFTITVKNLSDPSAPTAPTSTSTAAPAAVSTLAAAVSTPAASVPAATTAVPVTADSLMDAHNPILPLGAAIPASETSPTAAATAPTAAERSNMTPDDAYWAGQPAAVQALRNMPDDQVLGAATQLAKEGYTIDVPIMVWHWDPLTTMVERQNYGYTWVPSALQSPVQLPPGLTFPGLASYDPNNPPPGSIQVTTAFAAGTNMQNVFIDPAEIAASMTASTTS